MTDNLEAREYYKPETVRAVSGMGPDNPNHDPIACIMQSATYLVAQGMSEHHAVKKAVELYEQIVDAAVDRGYI